MAQDRQDSSVSHQRHRIRLTCPYSLQDRKSQGSSKSRGVGIPEELESQGNWKPRGIGISGELESQGSWNPRVIGNTL